MKPTAAAFQIALENIKTAGVSRGDAESLVDSRSSVKALLTGAALGGGVRILGGSPAKAVLAGGSGYGLSRLRSHLRREGRIEKEMKRDEVPSLGAEALGGAFGGAAAGAVPLAVAGGEHIYDRHKQRRANNALRGASIAHDERHGEGAARRLVAKIRAGKPASQAQVGKLYRDARLAGRRVAYSGMGAAYVGMMTPALMLGGAMIGAGAGAAAHQLAGLDGTHSAD